MNVYALGASRNIGYYATLRLLEKGATVTFLLRSPSVYEGDAAMQAFISSGHARIVQGDALKPADVAKGWEAASHRDSEQGSTAAHVDLVLFTVGIAPSGFSLTKGALIDPPDLCTRALLNLLRTIPPSILTSDSQPKIIALSSIGIGHESHEKLPLLYKPFYSWGLAQPHADKLGMERILTWCAGQPWTDGDLPTSVLEEGWRTSAPEGYPALPAEGALKSVVIVRAALLTSGVCMADEQKNKAGKGAKEKPAYKVYCDGKEMKGKHGYTISRQDVAHCIVENIVPNWSQWEGKRVAIAY
ncbi:hypothetical protein BC835DRAFT_1340766 [Cytidiella melzeri]|nr:hypothetical protein BC835DRAFT_1340766 [Cytidiella melzeri]